jgi:hypothetical protein
MNQNSFWYIKREKGAQRAIRRYFFENLFETGRKGTDY